MKTTLLLCLVVALAGCKPQSTAATESTGVAGPTAEAGNRKMDSPIIISDGSTHLKHKDKVANIDFKITYNGSLEQVIVNDSGYSVGAGVCVAGVKPADCPPAFTTNPLATPWTLDLSNAAGVKFMTISSTDNMSVATNFYGHFIDIEQDGSDGNDANETNETSGTEIIQHDFKFRSASFTSGGTMVPIPCTSSPCKLKINYSHP